MEENESRQDYAEQQGGQSRGSWTYSANTNQYSAWEGKTEHVNQNPEYHQGYQGQNYAQSGRQEYGTQYGYYGNGQGNSANYSQNYSQQQDPNYYSQKYGQWDFNRYESNTKSKKSSGKGFKVFIIIVCVILAICLISLAGFGIYSKISGKNPFSFSFSIDTFGNSKDTQSIPEVKEYEESGNTASDGETQGTTESSTAGASAPELTLDSKPGDDGIGSAKVLSAAEIYSHVNPSVVGVIQYQYSKSMDATGSGSGVIISSDGYIITNAHVVSGAEAVKVVLYDENEYDATIVGSDSQSDIAVLKVTADGLVAAELGDSSLAEVGEDVYALGNPGGLTLQSSFTKGIISGLNRTITTSDSIYPITVLQTDAAINPGNSGGALINEYGQVIGITNSKLVSTTYEGVGFAIPTATAIPLAQELIENGYVSGRAILGISGRTIDSTTAKYYSVPQGVQITVINDDSSFKETDAKIGDIITAINGKSISNMTELQKVLSTMKPGQDAEITLYRYASQRENDKSFTIKVRLKENKN